MRWIAASALVLAASPALAEDRDYCPTRPGLGTTPCTIAPKHVSVETALTDWTLDDQTDQRTDTVLIGDTFVRVGLTDTIEAQSAGRRTAMSARATRRHRRSIRRGASVM